MTEKTKLPPTEELEGSMPQFRCMAGKHNHSIDHGATTTEVRGLALCGGCNEWTPYHITGGLLHSVDEAAVPIRVCPNCGAKAAFRRRWEWPPNGDEIGALDSCSACGFTAYFKSSDRQGKSVIDQYPKVIRNPQDELPAQVKTAYAEALQCYGAGAPNGALLMCRRAIQEALDERGAKKGDLPTQLNDLVTQYKITPDLKDWADHARIGGKLAGHGTGGKEWGDPSKVWGDSEDAEAVLEFCEAFFEYLYVLPERNKQRRSRIAPPPATQ